MVRTGQFMCFVKKTLEWNTWISKIYSVMHKAMWWKHNKLFLKDCQEPRTVAYACILNCQRDWSKSISWAKEYKASSKWYSENIIQISYCVATENAWEDYLCWY